MGRTIFFFFSLSLSSKEEGGNAFFLLKRRKKKIKKGFFSLSWKKEGKETASDALALLLLLLKNALAKERGKGIKKKGRGITAPHNCFSQKKKKK